MAPPRNQQQLSLPASLLSQIGGQQSGHGRKYQPSRKDQRKAQRVEKKRPQPSRPVQKRPVVKPRPRPEPIPRRQGNGSRAKDEDDDMAMDNPFSEDESGASDAFESDDGGFDNPFSEDEEGASDAFESGSDDEPKAKAKAKTKTKTQELGKAAKRKFEEDDAEIAALEKKLGLKKGSKSKAIDEDGLGELLGELDDDDGDDGDQQTSSQSKRKAEADEWLAQKRRKANAAAAAAAAATAAETKPSRKTPREDEDEDMGGMENPFSEDEDGASDAFGSDDEDDEGEDDDFGGFSDEDADTEAAPRKRENPYVAPTTGVAKYVPPSLRKKAESEGEVDAQLRRRVQGLINRLTNENMVGILNDFKGLYESFSRQGVTSALVSLIMTLVCSPEKRPDSFFTMIAGFVAGAHKSLQVGDHVSAHLVQRIVEVFGEHYDKASGDHSDAACKHLVALLAELYSMGVVGSTLLYDYIRLFSKKLSELNTELLLRIIQMCGPALRREDVHSLKEVVNQIQPADLKGASVRTQFMVEEMRNLQSNKAKAGARNKDLAEQRTQIRKRIGSLAGPRQLQPLNVGLKDIQNADKNGRWWMVGASWSGNLDKEKTDTRKGEVKATSETGAYCDDIDDLLGPDLWQVAREQGFNTETRQRIFVALHGATNYENAELQINNLRLNKHQRKEIAEVIVRSGERQADFNFYYWLVATRFCSNREHAFQFRRSLTTRFRKMGEEIETGDGVEYEADEADEYDQQSLYNVAKFYGSLVAHGSLHFDLLKYRNLAALQEKTRWFVEMMLLTVLQECGTGEQLQKVVDSLASTPDLARGIQYFIKKHVRKTKLVRDKKEKEQLKKQCDAAVQMVDRLLAADAEHEA